MSDDLVAIVTAKGRRWLQTGHPWVFAGDVAQAPADAAALVAVVDEQGRRLGWASVSPRSRIRLRLWSRGEEPLAPFEELFAARLRAALDRRRPLEVVTNAQRLVAAEADGLPGLIVDRYGDVLVVQAGTAFWEASRPIWTAALVRALAPRMLLARNDFRARGLEGLGETPELLHGERVEECEVHEDGVRQRVRPFAGQKTGLFLDQRPARRRVRERAAELQGDWLDVCSYQGGFALAALAGGAEQVLAIDASESALAIARTNAELSGLAGLETRRGDAFEELEALLAAGRRFAGIVVDPPAFAKSAREAAGAARAYERLNRLAMGLLAAGGVLFSCSCSQHLAPADFAAMLARAAAGAGRRLHDRGRLPPALDHPVLLGFPEGEYLKVHELQDAWLS